MATSSRFSAIRAATSRNAFIVAAALAFFGVALSGVIDYRDIRMVIDNFDEARRDVNMILALDQILEDVINAETGQRGYILTGDRDYLDPYEDAARKIESDFERAYELISGEAAQQERLRVLRLAIADKFAEMDRTIATYDREGAAAAVALVNAGRGRAIMGTIRSTMSEIRNEEQRQRDFARVQADASSRRALQGVVISTSISGVLLLLTFAQFAAARRASELARENAESANRVKDQFIATVSHELRSPLTAILGWSAMLTDGRADRNVMMEGARAIQRSASVQKKLIEDLLDVSRIMTGKLRLSMRTIDLGDSVLGAVEAMRPAAAAKSITITTEIDRGIRTSGDPDRLQQIIWNLVTNAVKFTPRGGTIDVTLTPARSYATLEVRDSGEGIDASFLPHVFEPFRQSDSSRARVHKGLGLGLSIVKYLVEAHGGTISVWSAGKGEGSTFRISLPIMPIVHGEIADDVPAPFTVDATASAIVLPASDALRGMSALVVDDHEPTLDILELVLERCGATVFRAKTSAEALAMFGKNHPDVILSDIAMPGEDALAFIDRVRSLPATEGGMTPAIALTAYVRSEEWARVLSGRFHKLLIKPVEPVELVNAITTVAARPRSQTVGTENA